MDKHGEERIHLRVRASGTASGLRGAAAAIISLGRCPACSKGGTRKEPEGATAMRRARLTAPGRGRRRRPVGEGRADGAAKIWGFAGLEPLQLGTSVCTQGSESGKLSGVIWVVFSAAIAAISISGNDRSW